ncbi:MAG: ankyrin [Sphingomonas bacterium]|nr:ankyrin repeat domain-containing protein [Sphingomonas bacterium]MDB5689487.1 ankyrin [Sphingomonas bacterium]
MNRFGQVGIAAIAATMLIAPAQAQFSESYKFLKAVREGDGAKVNETLDAPGSTMIDTRDYTTGETALHIVVKRRDTTWLGFLLARGAKPDVRDTQGNTPLALAAQLGFTEGVQQLIDRRANVNLENSQGVTPIISSVQNRDLATTRLLLAAGANPARADRIAGKSARDYAVEDRRSAALLKIIDDAKPAKLPPKVSGPTL